MAGVEFPVKLVCKKRDNTDRHTKMCGETATNKTDVLQMDCSFHVRVGGSMM